MQNKPGARLVIPQGQEVLKDVEGSPQSRHSPFKEVLSGPGRATSNIHKDNNCNELKHIKYISIHKFTGVIKKEKKKKEEQTKPLKTHKNALVLCERCQDHQLLTSELVSTGEESNTSAALPASTAGQADHLGETGGSVFLWECPRSDRQMEWEDIPASDPSEARVQQGPPVAANIPERGAVGH